MIPVTWSLPPVVSRLAGARTSTSGESVGFQQAMSWMWPWVSSAQRTCTRIPVLISSAEATSTACSIGASAPSRVIRANANGRSKGWPATGSGTQVQVVTVPVSGRSTKSVTASWVDRVELRRRHDHPSVRETGADQLAVPQAGEEAAQHRADGSGVIEGHLHRRLQGAGHGRK